MLPMILLKSLLPNHILEGVDLPPPEVSFLTKPHSHAYSKAAGDGAGKQYYQGNVDFSAGASEDSMVSKAANVIKKFENSRDNKRGRFDKNKGKWFPHKSLESGSDTIAYGHKIQRGEDFSKGLTDSEAGDLLNKDVRTKIKDLKALFVKHNPHPSIVKGEKQGGFNLLPLEVKIATINASFRGDLGPKTIELLAKNKFKEAAKEYLNHKEYSTTSNSGVKKRMEWNAKVFNGAQ